MAVVTNKKKQIVILNDSPCNDGKTYKLLFFIKICALIFWRHKNKFEFRLINLKKKNIVFC